MPEPETMTNATPDLHGGNIAPFVATKLKIPGCIVLVSNEDGTIGLMAHGVNHARATEMLSVGTYLTLDQHYAAVRAGHAGAQAAEHQRELDNYERKEMTQ